jgi:hypothetical protein
MIGGVMNMAGTAAGMEQSRRQNRDYMSALFPQSAGGAGGNSSSGFNGMPLTANGELDYDLMRSQGMISTFEDAPPSPEDDPIYYPTGNVPPSYPTGAINRPGGMQRGYPQFDAQQFGRDFVGR